MPVTGISFLAAWLAISGIPPFAGFFSKDEILWNALATPNVYLPWLPMALYGVLLFTSLLTAFYMTRLVVMTFFGEFRGSRSALEKLRESSWSMTGPLVVLAFGSLVVGWWGVPSAMGGSQSFGHFLDPMFRGSMPDADSFSTHLEPLFMVLAFLVALLGVGLGWAVYARKKAFVVEEAERRIPHLRDILVHKFWVDEIYEATILNFVRFLSQSVSYRFLELKVIGGSVAVVVDGARAAGRLVTRGSSGLVRWTVAGMVLGAALLLYWWIR
jgi:NADH-quinone oxidoreductase subunit L